MVRNVLFSDGLKLAFIHLLERQVELFSDFNGGQPRLKKKKTIKTLCSLSFNKNVSLFSSNFFSELRWYSVVFQFLKKVTSFALSNTDPGSAVNIVFTTARRCESILFHAWIGWCTFLSPKALILSLKFAFYHLTSLFITPLH